MIDDFIFVKICVYLKEIVLNEDLIIGFEIEFCVGFGLNFLDVVDLVMLLEEEFDIELFDEEL